MGQNKEELSELTAGLSPFEAAQAERDHFKAAYERKLEEHAETLSQAQRVCEERDEWKSHHSACRAKLLDAREKFSQGVAAMAQERDEWRQKALDVESHPVVVKLTERLAELRQERDAANSQVEAVWSSWRLASADSLKLADRLAAAEAQLTAEREAHGLVQLGATQLLEKLAAAEETVKRESEQARAARTMLAKGWPAAKSWLDSNMEMERAQFADRLAAAEGHAQKLREALETIDGALPYFHPKFVQDQAARARKIAAAALAATPAVPLKLAFISRGEWAGAHRVMREFDNEAESFEAQGNHAAARRLRDRLEEVKKELK